MPINHPDINVGQFTFYHAVEKNEGDVHLSFDQMKELKFTEAFVKESLRSWGINFVERTCTTEYHIPELNITIPKGALVQIPGSSIMHEERFFQVLQILQILMIQ